MTDDVLKNENRRRLRRSKRRRSKRRRSKRRSRSGRRTDLEIEEGYSEKRRKYKTRKENEEGDKKYRI